MLKQILIALDQLFNTLGCGMADETISARAWREGGRDSRRVRFINWLFQDPNHCKDSFRSEQERKQLPAEYRG